MIALLFRKGLPFYSHPILLREQIHSYPSSGVFMFHSGTCHPLYLTLRGATSVLCTSTRNAALAAI